MMETDCLGAVRPEDTGFGYTLSVIGGKYKIIILYWLSEYKPVMRFNELKRCIQTISFKTLSNTLKEMEEDQLIIRREYPQIPPKVEYSLSERGKSLKPIIDLLCHWGLENSAVHVDAADESCL